MRSYDYGISNNNPKKNTVNSEIIVKLMRII